MASSLSTALDIVLKLEGVSTNNPTGYADIPGDPGGETNWGISTKYYRGERAQGKFASLPSFVKDLTRADAELIYEQGFWLPSQASKLPWPLSLLVFDTAVNMGNDDAKLMVQTMQRFINTLPDGDVGPKTLEALKTANLDWLWNELLWWRLQRYTAITRVNKTNHPERVWFLYLWAMRLLGLRNSASS